MPDTLRKSLTNIGNTMKIKQMVLAIVYNRNIIMSLIHCQRTEYMFYGCFSGHETGKIVRVTKITAFRGESLIRNNIKITNNFINGGQRTFHFLIQCMHIISSTDKNSIAFMFTFRTIINQQTTDNNAVNT